MPKSLVVYMAAIMMAAVIGAVLIVKTSPLITAGFLTAVSAYLIVRNGSDGEL